MIEVKVDQASVGQTIDYLEAMRKRIFGGVKDGMREAMEGLAGVAVLEMGAAGIQSRTGELAENILKSPHVGEDAKVIVGWVTAKATMKIKGRSFEGFLGTALDEGYHVPTVDASLFRFSEPDAGTLYSRGHMAFDVKPHPFMKSAADAFAPSLIDIIQSRVNAAIAETA